MTATKPPSRSRSKAPAATTPDSRPEGAPVYVCKEGVLIPFARRAPSLETAGKRPADLPVSPLDGLLLPGCRTSDRLRAQPPLSIRPNLAELYAILQAEPCGLRAASIFGPPQEKHDNEDFALTAAISTENGPCLFAAVADGVSTRTFWPQRASRIACFTALRVFMRHASGSPDLGEASLRSLRQQLISALTDELAADKRLLIKARTVPADWNPDTYRKHQAKLNYWYNTTLLVAFASPAGLLLFWSGDGGISLLKEPDAGEPIRSTPLTTDAAVAVTNIVSLGGQISFSMGRIPAPGLRRVTACLMTDGVDRTLQRSPDGPHLMPPETSPALRRRLEQLAAADHAEVDNYSAAFLSWPPPGNDQPRMDLAMVANMLVSD